MGWLQNYQSDADKSFNNSVTSNGKGFNITINDLLHGYKDFLDPVTYTSPNSQEAINKSNLNQSITNISNKWLHDGLTELPQNLNIDTSNVVNKSTLDSYTNWIKNYQDFINKNKDKWINDIVNASARGFATTDQENQIQNQVSRLLDNSNIKNYLKHVIWTPTANLATSNDYKQFIKLDKLQSDTIDWVNQNIPEINTTYQNALNQAESGLNLHGYSIDKILDGKRLPQTKKEIENFKDGQSFHDWLQAKADNMYHIWQLKVGVPIGLILLVAAIFGSLACYWKFSARHNPIKRADKKHKPINPKKLNNSKKNNN